MGGQNISKIKTKTSVLVQICVGVVLVTLIGLSGCQETTAPKIVVSIPPIHSLVSSVMAGADTPFLLMDGKSSPHTMSMRPSQASALSRAELVIWIGPSLEAGLRKAIDNRGNRAVLQISRVEGLELLSNTLGAVHDHGASKVSGNASNVDPHLWLMPKNALRIIDAVLPMLSELDPANAGLYQQNADVLRQQVKEAEVSLRETLKPLRQRHYAVLHNAFRYFEVAMELDHALVLKHRSDTPIGMASLQTGIEKVGEMDISCLLVDPQHDVDLAMEIARQKSLTVVTIDPMGSTIEPGPTHYLNTLEAVGVAFTECLSS